MCAMFSLVSLLVTVAIIAWVWSSYNGTVVKEGQATRRTVPTASPAMPRTVRPPSTASRSSRRSRVASFARCWSRASCPAESWSSITGSRRATRSFRSENICPSRKQDSGMATAEMQEAYMRKDKLPCSARATNHTAGSGWFRTVRRFIGCGTAAQPSEDPHALNPQPSL